MEVSLADIGGSRVGFHLYIQGVGVNSAYAQLWSWPEADEGARLWSLHLHKCEDGDVRVDRNADSRRFLCTRRYHPQSKV